MIGRASSSPRASRLVARAAIATLIGAALGVSPLASSAVPAAHAATTTDVASIAESLRRDPVYVAPGVDELTPDEADEVRAAIRGASTAVYVAVLPGNGTSDDTEAAALLGEIANATDLSGTYAVVVGRSLRAGSTFLPSGQAGQLAGAAAQANSGGRAAAVLLDFVDRISAAARSNGQAPSGAGSNGTTTGQGTPASERRGDDGGIGLGTILLVGGAAGAGVWAWRRSRRNKADRTEADRAATADRQMLSAELSVLADDVLRVEQDVLLNPAAREDYDAAVNRYRAAQAALEYADEPIDLIRVRRVLDEATYSMQRAKAIIAGRTPPEPPAELRQPGRHGEPAIELDEDRRPAYVGYGGPFQTGWFGGGNGLFSGLLLGSMLGGFGPFGWGGGFGGTTVINEGDTYMGGGDGGFGGGGFGDFGGGDFGGGGDW